MTFDATKAHTNWASSNEHYNAAGRAVDEAMIHLAELTVDLHSPYPDWSLKKFANCLAKLALVRSELRKR